jgi:hypothetical protein
MMSGHQQSLTVASTTSYYLDLNGSPLTRLTRYSTYQTSIRLVLPI